MASNSRSFEFTAAVPDYHVYQKIWQPELTETLVCIHQRQNEFNAFSVKTVRAIDNATVGHLPREISRSTKYLLDRGATVKAVITCSYYRRSPLFQGGLEIPCLVTVSMPGAIQNNLLLDRQRELVTELYCEPKDDIAIGNILSPTEQVPIERPQKRQKRVSVPEKEMIQCKDIRLLFRCQEENNKNQDKNKETNETIVIDQIHCIQYCMEKIFELDLFVVLFVQNNSSLIKQPKKLHFLPILKRNLFSRMTEMQILREN